MKWAVVALVVSSSALGEEADIDASADDGNRVGRVAAEIGAALLGAALPNLLWVPFFYVGQRSFSGPSAAGPVLVVCSMLLEPLTISTSSWLVHRKMGGKGLWPAAFGGTMLGAAFGGLVFALGGYMTQLKNDSQVGPLCFGSIMTVLAATVFILEVHHTQNVSVSAAPLPNGGAIGALSVRF